MRSGRAIEKRKKKKQLREGGRRRRQEEGETQTHYIPTLYSPPM
ncbi:hypothetical protein RE438_22810 [Bacillus wiedmannii]|nr:hypothetical protein [Bacillus wiedmannii]MCQ6541671.1 hypothetical protein [Bacillus wiedmannii]MCQ6571487.1 hypothetical protein [Bacillus wiedmannii]WMS81272.1 hypothetical protein RE438_22810 [Bacillus wiedmannii]